MESGGRGLTARSESPAAFDRRCKQGAIISLALLLLVSSAEWSVEPETSPPVAKGPDLYPPVSIPERLVDIQEEFRVSSLCREIGRRLGSVSVGDCLALNLTYSGRYSVKVRPLVTREFPPADGRVADYKVLIMGGIHGDEYSSISLMFKWMSLLRQSDNRDALWRFMPAVNPDGLLEGPARRQNSNDVDLNRNFPSRDWNRRAKQYWQETTGGNPRRYPGEEPGSEPEVRWLVEQISTFDPDVIVSVHAPYHLLDFDGPIEAPERIGELYLHQLGVFPGSLGNYAGIDLGIPVVTLELPSAGIMPTDEQVLTMWTDLVAWLNGRAQHSRARAATAN